MPLFESLFSFRCLFTHTCWYIGQCWSNNLISFNPPVWLDDRRPCVFHVHCCTHHNQVGVHNKCKLVLPDHFLMSVKTSLLSLLNMLYNLSDTILIIYFYLTVDLCVKDVIILNFINVSIIYQFSYVLMIKFVCFQLVWGCITLSTISVYCEHLIFRFTKVNYIFHQKPFLRISFWQ